MTWQIATLPEAYGNWEAVLSQLERMQDAANVHTLNKAKMYLRMLSEPQPDWIRNDVTREEYFRSVFTACRDLVNCAPNMRTTNFDILKAKLRPFI